MPTISRLSAIEILDSRGRPTVRATCQLASGVRGTASIPSGASTGAAEALELRDGEPRRYRGLGCRKAVSNINGELQNALQNRSFGDQCELDEAILALDGTPNKARIGANALLGVSIAFARASALERQIPLYRYFADMIGGSMESLPRPMINLFSGGKHAGGQVAIQDVQVMPLTAGTTDELLAMTVEIFQCAAELIHRRYGMRLLRADEGGLAPPFPDTKAMFEGTIEAIQAAGFEPGQDVALTVDVAASQFYRGGNYHLESETLNGDGMVERLIEWRKQYPIISIEDGLAEEDWQHWTALQKTIGPSTLVVGDDLLCTNPERIRQAIEAKAANTLLLKVNQIGTLTEAAEANRLAKSNGWRVIVSARSGETEDDWLADLAVGWAGDHIKIGSITQSERLVKYNRLLEIEGEMGLSLAPFSVK